MEFTNNNDVLITLNIKDKRGKNIRVSSLNDIKIKVWTHTPDCALTFDYRNIVQKEKCDILVIKGSQMEALPSGVISYSYRYKIYETNLPNKKHQHPVDFYEVVITEIFWKNRFKENIIESPTYYHSLEYMRDIIDAERDERIKQYKELEDFIREGVDYTTIQIESERAQGEEKRIEEKFDGEVNRVKSEYTYTNTLIANEVTRAKEEEINIKTELKGEIKGLEEKIPTFLEGLASEIYVDEKIGELSTIYQPIGEYLTTVPDTYALKTYVDGKVTGLASETYVNGKVSGLASETYVNGKIDVVEGKLLKYEVVSQKEYDDKNPKDPDTFYFIREDE